MAHASGNRCCTGVGPGSILLDVHGPWVPRVFQEALLGLVQLQQVEVDGVLFERLASEGFKALKTRTRRERTHGAGAYLAACAQYDSMKGPFWLQR